MILYRLASPLKLALCAAIATAWPATSSQGQNLTRLSVSVPNEVGSAEGVGITKLSIKAAITGSNAEITLVGEIENNSDSAKEARIALGSPARSIFHTSQHRQRGAGEPLACSDSTGTTIDSILLPRSICTFTVQYSAPYSAEDGLGFSLAELSAKAGIEILVTADGFSAPPHIVTPPSLNSPNAYITQLDKIGTGWRMALYDVAYHLIDRQQPLRIIGGAILGPSQEKPGLHTAAEPLVLGEKMIPWHGGETSAMALASSDDAIRISLSNPPTTDGSHRIVLQTEIGGRGRNFYLESEMPIEEFAIGMTPPQPDNSRMIIVQRRTNGGQCCVLTDLFLLLGSGDWEASAIPHFPGELWSETPGDVTGDGFIDLEIPDYRFAGLFGALAATPMPPILYDARGETGLIDIRSFPESKAYYQAMVDDAKQDCLTAGPEFQGFCAYYGAISALIGQWPEASALITKLSQQQGASDFAPILENQLEEFGYLTPAIPQTI